MPTAPNTFRAGPDERGHFGIFGGRYVAETLMPLILELEKAYNDAKADPAFQGELASLAKHYAGRPSPLYHAARLTRHLGGAKVYLKREELNHTGSHKINNVLGQVLLAKHYAGRPSPLYHARRLTQHLGGAKVYFKREELNHTGSHKINNCMGQILLAMRMGKTRIIAETGAGDRKSVV